MYFGCFVPFFFFAALFCELVIFYSGVLWFPSLDLLWIYYMLLITGSHEAYIEHNNLFYNNNNLTLTAYKHFYLLTHSLLFFFKDFIYLFLERGGGREKERERNISVVASHLAPTGNLACNPGMCHDWELNLRPSGSQPTLNPLSYTRQALLCFNVAIYFFLYYYI